MDVRAVYTFEACLGALPGCSNLDDVCKAFEDDPCYVIGKLRAYDAHDEGGYTIMDCKTAEAKLMAIEELCTLKLRKLESEFDYYERLADEDASVYTSPRYNRLVNIAYDIERFVADIREVIDGEVERR